MTVRSRDERGAVLVLTALLMVALFLVVALVIDFGFTRSERRNGQLAADTAAAAAGRILADPAANARLACAEAEGYLRVALDVPSFQYPSGRTCNDIDLVCAASVEQAPVELVSGSFTVLIHYPVVSGTETGDRLLNRTSTIGGGDLAAGGVGDTAADACARMGVEIRTDGDAFFGGIAGQQNRTSRVHAVVFGKPSPGGRDIPAFLMLERVDCGSLVDNGARGIFVRASSQGPGTVHADSLATGDCSGSTKGFVVYGTPLPASAGGGTSIRVDSYTPPSGSPVAGQINVAAAATTARAGAVYPGGLSVAPTPGADLISRRPVDQKYNSAGNPAITTLHATAYNALTGALTGYVEVQCTDPIPAGTSKLFVNCPGDYSGSSNFTGVEDVVFSHGLNLGNGNNVAFDDAIRVVIRGQLAIPQGSAAFPKVKELYVGGGVTVGNNGSLAVYSNSPTSCPTPPTPMPATIPSSEPTPATRVVVFGGSPALDLNNESSFCETTAYLAGPLTSSNSTYAGTGAADPQVSRQMLTSGSPHSSCTTALPCPRKTTDGNTAVGATFSLGGGTTVLWNAPNRFSGQIPSDRVAGLEDLALWMEGGETANIGSNGQYQVKGVTFAPNARVNLSSPAAAVPQDAQFIARQLWLNQGNLTMQPSEGNVVDVPGLGSSSLIR